jgi:hypothetical protein
MVIPVSMVIVSGVVVLSFNCCYWWWEGGREGGAQEGSLTPHFLQQTTLYSWACASLCYPLL